jgi:hypothetical protein
VADHCEDDTGKIAEVNGARVYSARCSQKKKITVPQLNRKKIFLPYIVAGIGLVGFGFLTRYFSPLIAQTWLLIGPVFPGILNILYILSAGIFIIGLILIPIGLLQTARALEQLTKVVHQYRVEAATAEDQTVALEKRIRELEEKVSAKPMNERGVMETTFQSPEPKLEWSGEPLRQTVSHSGSQQMPQNEEKKESISPLYRALFEAQREQERKSRSEGS